MKNPNLKWWVLATVMVGTFLGRIDQTIVNLALPHIIDDFSISVSSAGWIATAYILANAIFVPVWGKLGDTTGRKRIYLWGFIIFIAGSVLAGLSWNLSSMIVFRVIQAIASSADYPTAMAIITVTFERGKARAQALGIWSASFAVAAVFGPLIGGPLIDLFGWRSVFLVNLPVGLIGLAMAYHFVEESVSENKSFKFDWWGAIHLGVALAALVLVLDKGMDWGWLSTESMIAYAVTLIFFYLFYVTERDHPEPIVDLKFFRNNVFVQTLLNNFIVFFGLIGSVFLVPLFAQTFLGYNSTQIGYLFLPMAAALMIGAPLGGRLSGKVQPRYVIIASTLVAAIGMFLFSYLDPRASAWNIAIPMAIMAFGLGFGMAQRTSVIASAVPESEIGIASSVLALVRNIAGAFGIAVFASLLTNRIEWNVLNTAANSAIHSTNPEVIKQGVGLMILHAQVSAYGYLYVVGASILVVGAILAWWIKVEHEKMGVEVMVD